MPKPPSPAVTRDDVRVHLLTLDKEKLVDILMLRAERDPQLRDQLFVEAAKGRSSNGALDIRALRETLDRAIETGGYIDWRGASSYARGVDNAIDALIELFEQGHDAELLELVEYPLKRVEDAAGQVQDDGDLGLIFDRLHELHLNICARARPDPVALAKRLFEWELASGWGSFHDCTEKYAEIFGDAGQAEYRRLAELAWKNVRALGPGQKDVPDGRRRDLARIMTKLAEKDGVGAVVDVLKKDLSTPNAFLRIAETYRKSGSHELAVRWAERGLSASEEPGPQAAGVSRRGVSTGRAWRRSPGARLEGLRRATEARKLRRAEAVGGGEQMLGSLEEEGARAPRETAYH